MVAFPKIVCFVWIREMEFYKMDLKKNVPRHILFHIGDSCEVRSFFRLSSKTLLTLLEKEV